MLKERLEGRSRAVLRHGLIVAVCVSAGAGFAGCGGSGGTVTEEETQRARALLVPFRQELQAALGEALAEGVESAIDVCRVKAPEIAAARSSGGVTMGRTSHRLRNPRNAPEPWLEPLLDEYIDRKGDTTPRAVRLADGSIGYVEPIYVQPLCLTCHGTEIAPSVAERLRDVYPGDEGRGFAEGDFRGLFWVRVPPSR